MESLAQQAPLQTDRIFELLSYYLETGSDLSKSSFDMRKQKRFVDRKPIQRLMNELKWNIQKITQTCQFLQNQNRVLKRMITRSGSASSMYYIENHNPSTQIENSLLNKYLSKVTSSRYSNGFQMSSFQQNHLKESLYNSSAQFEKIKQEVNGLTEGLKYIQKAYDKYELDSTDDRQIKDMFLDQPSLVRFGSKSSIERYPSTSREETSLEHLLCDEELSFDDMPLQQKSVQKVSNEQNMVESLIAKGIEFRECRAMRSKEYQTLSGLIQQYREDIQNKENIEMPKVQQISKYR